MGRGSLGSDKDAAEELSYSEREVKVERVPLQKYSAATNEAIRPTGGSFAYWVGDEGVKAKVSVPDGTDEKFLKNSDWERLFNVVAQKNGVSLVSGLSSFDSWWEKDLENASTAAGTRLPYVSDAGTLPAYASALGGGNATEVKEYAQRLFHDVSYVSKGIFTDTYNGGLKTDLSLAFEMPWEKEGQWTKGFRDFKQFHGSGEKNKLTASLISGVQSTSRTKWWLNQPNDGLGYLYEIAAGNETRNGRTQKYLRGPTWDLVRNYYRLYKREDEKLGFLGLKPSRDDVWIAVGSYPYSNSVEFGTKSSSVSYPYGTKSNYSLLSSDSLNKYYPALLTEFSGESIQINGTTANPIIPQSMQLTPAIQKIVMNYGLRLTELPNGQGKKKTQLQLIIAPMVTIHNPYNVPIEFSGFSLTWNTMNPFGMRLIRVNTSSGEGEGEGKGWIANDSRGNVLEADPFFNTKGKHASNKLMFRAYSGVKDSDDNLSGTYILAPGEVRTFYPIINNLNSAGGKDSRLRDTALLYGVTEQNDIRIASQVQAITVIPEQHKKGEIENVGFPGTRADPNQEVDMSDLAEPDIVYATVEIKKASDSKHVDQFAIDMFYPKTTTGADANVSSTSASAEGKEFIDCFVRRTSDQTYYFPHEEPHLLASVISVRTNASGDNNPDIKRTFTLNRNSENVEYFMSDIIYRQPSEESPFASPLRTNPRAYSVSPYEYDDEYSGNSGAVGVGWKRRIEATNFNPWPEDAVGSRWGDSCDSSDGQTNIVLFEIPTAPLLSTGQLQHVNCSVLNSQPGYVIGNSYLPIGIDSQTEIFTWPNSSGNAVQPRGDISFAANLQLFDRYFFSGINVQGDGDNVSGGAQIKDIDTFVSRVFSKDDSLANPFPNRRISLIRDFGERKESEVKKDFYDPERVARDLVYDGSFNVNSTSKEAWKAVLSGLHGKMLKLDDKFKEISDTPLARFAAIIGSKLGGFQNLGGSKDGDGDEGSGWRWYCELSSSEIDKLAESIVEQVRSRGPFMSLGDFVNRRLGNGDSGKSGALQAAIDASGINAARKNKLNDSWKSPESSRFPGLSGLSSGARLNKAGVPGYVTQGDILSAIAPALSARSDTFTIRAYGDVFGVSGTPEARAWCEAVVQRTPELFDPQYDEETDDEQIDVVKFRENYRDNQSDSVSGRGNKYVLEKWDRNDKASAVNKLFGRRYKIVSFRWLSQDEL